MVEFGAWWVEGLALVAGATSLALDLGGADRGQPGLG